MLPIVGKIIEEATIDVIANAVEKESEDLMKKGEDYLISNTVGDRK